MKATIKVLLALLLITACQNDDDTPIQTHIVINNDLQGQNVINYDFLFGYDAPDVAGTNKLIIQRKKTGTENWQTLTVFEYNLHTCENQFYTPENNFGSDISGWTLRWAIQDPFGDILAQKIITDITLVKGKSRLYNITTNGLVFLCQTDL